MIKPNARLVYVAGPYTHGDVELNVIEAKRCGAAIMQSGHAPYIPHLNHHFHAEFPQDCEDWFTVQLVILRRCDIVFRIPGYSPGADREVQEALRCDLPVFFTEQELLAALEAEDLTDGVRVA